MGDWYSGQERVCKGCGRSYWVKKHFESDFFNPDPCRRCGGYSFEVHHYTRRHTFRGKWFLPWTWNHIQTETKFEWTEEAR